MRLYKVKIDKTIREKITEIKHTYGAGWAVQVQSINYTSTNPSKYIHLLDAAGDEFMFAIPGQATKDNVTPEIPVWVRLPLFYFDEEGEAGLTLWGQVEKIDTTIETNL